VTVTYSGSENRKSKPFNLNLTPLILIDGSPGRTDRLYVHLLIALNPSQSVAKEAMMTTSHSQRWPVDSTQEALTQGLTTNPSHPRRLAHPAPPEKNT
jgi:hypothetical protein